MRDYKRAQAGDQEEILQPSENVNASNESRGYVASLILLLESFTGKTLSEMETKWWKDRLQRYPMWKLRIVGNEYTGGLNNGVFAFMDQLRYQAPAYQAPQLAEPKSSIAKDCLEHRRNIYRDGTPEQKDAWEREGIAALNKKYPHLNFKCGRKNNMKNF